MGADRELARRGQPSPSWRWELGGPHPVAQARALVCELLSAHEVDDHVNDVVLVTSELVTNAVVHGRPPFLLAATTGPDRTRVEVRDHSPVAPAARAAEDDEEHGRGLLIVADVTSRWGVASIADGKVVWAEIDVLPAGVRPRTGDHRKAP